MDEPQTLCRMPHTGGTEAPRTGESPFIAHHPSPQHRTSMTMKREGKAIQSICICPPAPVKSKYGIISNTVHQNLIGFPFAIGPRSCQIIGQKHSSASNHQYGWAGKHPGCEFHFHSERERKIPLACAVRCSISTLSHSTAHPLQGRQFHTSLA